MLWGAAGIVGLNAGLTVYCRESRRREIDRVHNALIPSKMTEILRVAALGHRLPASQRFLHPWLTYTSIKMASPCVVIRAYERVLPGWSSAV